MGPRSVTAVQQAARSRRRSSAPSPSRSALLEAVATLTAGQGAVFTPAQVRQAMAAAGQPWAALTVKELLEQEVRAPAGHLARVRNGHYRLRAAGEGADVAGKVGVTPHVLAALRAMADAGRVYVTCAEVQGELADAGVPYSARSVSAGLLELTRARPAVVRRGADNRYRLVSRATAAQAPRRGQ